MDHYTDKTPGTRELLLLHFRAYPRMQTADIFKFLYQSAFGCEHMVSNETAAVEYIRRESEGVSGEGVRIDPLDGSYSRVHLSTLSDGLRPETLGRLFCLSARREEQGLAALSEKLETVRGMISTGELPLPADEFGRALAEWEAQGFPALHHSDEFRASYRPAYRVIADRFVKMLPIITEIDRALAKGRVLLAVEGGSASGKTTLAAALKEIYSACVFHMDDFFLRPEQRTPERFAEIGGNVDRERFLDEVLLPLRRGEDVFLRRFDCSTQTLEPPVRTEPSELTVIEGAYSMHPELAEHYTLSLFLDIDPELQRERILVRNSPAFARRFFEEWIPLERRYFEGTAVRERCLMTIRSRDL